MKVKGKALIVTTVASTIDQFCMNDISILLQDYDIQVAANFTAGNNTSEERIKEFKAELGAKNIIINEMDFNRNPVCIDNLIAYKKLKRLIEKNSFNLIHCHTPIAAMLTRLAAKRMRGKETKLIYTAHGFHFYKGAPLKNWLIYYPVERLLAKYTDVLITINKEDFERARTSFKARRVEYIPGVGIDIDKFNRIEINKDLKRNELGLPKDVFTLLSVGELNKNKNHEIVIRALADIKNIDIHYVICGKGVFEEKLKNLSKELGVEMRVHFLGFRKDILEIYKAVDLFVFPSYREGLSVALMEAMANGLPIVCSKIRGNSDLIEDAIGGYLLEANDIQGFSRAIERLISNNDLRNDFVRNNLERIREYSVENVLKQIKEIYNNN